jgi:hypothetical protein
MTWEDMIPSCFGATDGIFAGHPSDEAQAKDAIAMAQKAGATRDDFEKEMLWHVYKNAKHRESFWELVDNQAKKLEQMW